MKRVALRGRTSGFAPVMMLTQFPKSPAPIRASIMLLSCWGVEVGDGGDGGRGDDGGGGGGDDDGDGDGGCGGDGGEGEAAMVAVKRVVRKMKSREEWWPDAMGEKERSFEILVECFLRLLCFAL